MQQQSSLRLTTKPTEEQQAAADRAEETRISAIRHWRWRWYLVSVEIICLATAARRQDLQALRSHADHLRTIVDGAERTA